MSDNDRSYFKRRAETELGRAHAAALPDAARAHHQLAKAYLDKLANGGRAAS